MQVVNFFYFDFFLMMREGRRGLIGLFVFAIEQNCFKEVLVTGFFRTTFSRSLLDELWSRFGTFKKQFEFPQFEMLRFRMMRSD